MGEGRVFRGGWEEMADYDALFWDRIPVDERADAVWELSKELISSSRRPMRAGLPPDKRFCGGHWRYSHFVSARTALPSRRRPTGLSERL
jgi:hypothetical protein